MFAVVYDDVPDERVTVVACVAERRRQKTRVP
jgi:hypothetical protein